MKNSKQLNKRLTSPESDFPPYPLDCELDTDIDPEEDLTHAISFLSNEPDKQGKKKDNYFNIIGCYLNELHNSNDEAEVELYDLLKDMPKPGLEIIFISQFYNQELNKLADQQLLNLCHLAAKYNLNNKEFFDSALVLLEHMASDELKKTAEYQYLRSWQKVRQEVKAATISQSTQDQENSQVSTSWQALDTAMREFHTAARNPDLEPEMRKAALMDASHFLSKTVDNTKKNKSEDQRLQGDSFIKSMQNLVVERESSTKEVSAAKYKGLLGAGMMIVGAAVIVVGAVGVVASFVAAVPTFGLGVFGVLPSSGWFTLGLALFGKGLDLCHEAKKEKEEPRVLKVDPALRKASVSLGTAAKAVVAPPLSKILDSEKELNLPISRKGESFRINPAVSEKERGKKEEKGEEKSEHSFKHGSKEAKRGVNSSELDPQPGEKIVPLFPLHAAVKARDLVLIGSLLADKAVDINALDLPKKRTALEYAVRDEFYDIAIFLCKKGANAKLLPNDGYIAVVQAIENGRQDIAIALIDAGVDVQAKDDNEQTLLHHAAHWGQVGVVKKLIEKGADIEVKDNASRDPLYYAATAPQHRGSEAANFLLKNRSSQQQHMAAESLKVDNKEPTVIPTVPQRDIGGIVAGSVKAGATKATQFLGEPVPAALRRQKQLSSNPCSVFYQPSFPNVKSPHLDLERGCSKS